MHNFRQLEVWKKAMDLVEAIYSLVVCFPSTEKFGLTSQICRSAVSIPSNIAEGAGRKTDKDFSQFLAIALGSSYELETQLELSARLQLAPKSDIERILIELTEIQKMTWTLIERFKV